MPSPKPEFSESLVASQLMSDPRVTEAKRLLGEALAEHSAKLTDVRDEENATVQNYEELLNRLAMARGGSMYWPYIASGIGNGPFVELGNGSVKLDFIGGIGVHGLGHSHPAQMLAGVDAALEDTVMQGNLQQNLPTLEMCERLINLGNQHGAELKHCLLTTSGAMANENSLKIAFHNRPSTDRILALDGCFAGRTLALAQLTDKSAYRTGLPTTIAVDHIPTFCPGDPDGSVNFTSSRLKQLLHRWKGKYSCIWLELVSGEGGYYPGSTDFFSAIIDLCREEGILTIFDEVQTFSRLSQPYAFQHFDLNQYADIVTIGKISQVCATLYRGDLAPTAPILSQTFTGSTASIRCGLALLDELESAGCWGADSTNMSRHAYFANQLASLAEKYPGKISGPYGAGMMVGFTPGDGSAEIAKQMVTDLYNAGLLSFIAGAEPSRVRFLPPPGITTHEHIDHAIKIIESVVRS